MDKKQATLGDILEIVEFIKENSASKTDLTNLQSQITRLDKEVMRLDIKIESEVNILCKKIESAKNEMINHIDGFIGLHQKLDTEFTSLRSKCNRIESRQNQLEKYVGFQIE